MTEWETENGDRPLSDENSREFPREGTAEVLVVNGREDLDLRAQLDSENLKLTVVPDSQSAVTALETDAVDCLVTTTELPTADGIDLLEQVRERNCDIPVVLLAANGSEQLASEAISAGVTEYVPLDSETGSNLAARIEDLVTGQIDCVRPEELDGVEAAVEHAADAVVITDTDGKIEYINPAFEELTGYKREQAVGRNPRILKSGKQGASYYEEMWETILDGDIWEETIVNETQTGDSYIAHQTIAPVTRADGSIERFVGIQRDITRQQRLEEQLERSEMTLSRLYDFTADSAATLEDKIETVLTMGTRHLGYSVGYFTRIRDNTQEILSVAGNHDSIESGKTDPLERTYCRKTIEADEPVVISDAILEGWKEDPAFEEFGLRCYTGARVLVDDEPYGTICFCGEEPRDELILDAHKSTVRTLANWIGHEIEREQYERKLEQQNERLERFASAVSHDLRNPLNIAQSYVRLSTDAIENDSDTAAHLQRVIDAHGRMESIIDDTLTLAREGELVENPIDISLASVSWNCWQNVETTDTALEVEEDVSVRADPDKLRHILENLFRNAVEHAKGTDRTVRIGPTDDGFYIEDDGQGFDSEKSEQIFEFGYSTNDGSGFGLAIVETIAQAHGWAVHATESASGGARFEFDIDSSMDRCYVC